MMHLSQTNTKDFDVLVFNDRNQAYGAFVLRKYYSSTILKSLLIGVAIIASLLAIPYLNKLFTKEIVVSTYVPPTVYELTNVQQPEDKPKLPPETAMVPPATTVEFRNLFQITNEVPEEQVTAEDLKEFQPGQDNQIGDPDSWGFPGGNCPECEWVNQEPEKRTYDYVELQRKPKFPGGDEGLEQYLGDNLVYPDHARTIGLEGRVYVTFVIDEWGHVINVVVPREIGGGLDEEAARVVNNMPRWEPGMQGGHPVRVAYQLPIIFKLN